MKKISNHCYTTGKFRRATHWICNVNLKITKKVFLIFHGWKGYDSHIIMNKIDKFDVKVDVIRNEIEKSMAFTINKNSVFLDSIQLTKTSLEKL